MTTVYFALQVFQNQIWVSTYILTTFKFILSTVFFALY
jgi:hypothetical protein